MNNTMIQEISHDLFEIDGSYALAHCVATDLHMSAGIAVEFRNRFQRVYELSAQRQGVGGLAYLFVEGRIIYYLVTKERSSGKPTMSTLYWSLSKLREHMVAHGVWKLAIPRLGCGLDRLEWCQVREMIEEVFYGTGIEILVCHWSGHGGGRGSGVFRGRVRGSRGTSRPGLAYREVRDGDWICPEHECGTWNFAWRNQCYCCGWGGGGRRVGGCFRGRSRGNYGYGRGCGRSRPY